MKFTIDRDRFVKALKRCSGATDSKSTNPLCSCVLLSAEEETIGISATDLVIGASYTVGAEVSDPGSVAISARDLIERIKAMPVGPVTVSTGEDGRATISTTGSQRRFTVPFIPGDDFPKIPVGKSSGNKKTRSFKLPAATLLRLISRTCYAISEDDSRSHVNSALLERHGTNSVRMVATDGHRLSLATESVESVSEFESLLIPRRAVIELKRLLLDLTCADEHSIGVERVGPNALFLIDGLTFSSRLVDAQFPPYESVIPASNGKTMFAPRQQFLDSVRAVSLSSATKTHGIKLIGTVNRIRLETESPEKGKSDDELEVSYAGPDVTSGINSKYLVDALGSVDSDDVAVDIGAELDPVTIRYAVGGKADDSFIGVVMPMRLD